MKCPNCGEEIRVRPRRGPVTVTDDWEPPRCEHGHIILGCPHDDCVAQNEFLVQQEAALKDYERRQEATIRELFQ
jgi:hypothetical protein